jgi:TRAP-type C4-dicarboxylate transport system substrate-binding protein
MMPRQPIEIRLGGYGPPTTSFSRALRLIGDSLEAELGGGVVIRYVWNIMDFGYRSEDILWLAESGVLTLGYQSTSYFTDRVPELGLLDLPYLFETRDAARAAMDGRLGEVLAGKIEAGMNLRILGYFENGFRHISNRLRPVRRPADLAGMRIRVLPSDIQVRTFELLGAIPMRMDLTEAIERIRAGTIDAQENPLANTVTYGVHKFHRFHTLTSHFYLSRPVFLHRPSYEAWPAELRQSMDAAVRQAVAFQRNLAIEEEAKAMAELRREGCEVLELDADGHAAFVAAVRPLRADARRLYPPALLSLLP